MSELAAVLGDTRLPERFWAKVTPGVGGCWTWAGYLHRGYGRMWVDGGMRYVHRLSYSALVGEIPEGFQVDHLCKNRACVNPSHLEAVTQQENNARSDSVSARAARKTHCVRDHPLFGDNVHVDPKRGYRYCRKCRADAERERYANRKASA